jgi:small subunit ribosomal protein S18
MQNYNLYLILNPNLSSEDVGSELNLINQILVDDLNAQNISISEEGLKKLAYPIHKAWTGFYVNIDFDLALEDCSKIKTLEQKLNLKDYVIRYVVTNDTELRKQKAKEVLNKVEVTNHRELNKNLKDNKKCLSNYLGIREIDYKNIEFLGQFISPYAKIFGRERTGSSAKFQRKISKAVKTARHMALLPFTNIHQ